MIENTGTNIDYFNQTVRVGLDENILWLEVAVNDVYFVQRGKGSQYLP